MNTYWHTHSHTYYQFESRRKKCATITLLFAIKHNYAQQCPITHYLKSCLHCSSSCVSFFNNWAVYDVFHFQDINNDVSQPENLQSMHPFKNHFVCSSKHYIILVSNIFLLIHPYPPWHKNNTYVYMGDYKPNKPQHIILHHLLHFLPIKGSCVLWQLLCFS